MGRSHPGGNQSDPTETPSPSRFLTSRFYTPDCELPKAASYPRHNRGSCRHSAQDSSDPLTRYSNRDLGSERSGLLRLALAPHGPIGLRAGRAVLADRRLTALGVLGSDAHSRDPRVQTINSLEGWNAVLTDADSSDERILEAIRLQVPVITSQPLIDFGDSGATATIAAAGGTSGIPAALAIVLMENFDTVRSIKAAITVDQRKVRRDQSALFPDPIGALWCETAPSPVNSPSGLIFSHAPYDGSLRGISVQAEGTIDGRGSMATSGIVEDPLFLDAVALAGAAIMLLDGDAPHERFEVQRHAADYLAACRAVGLGVASFRGSS